VDHLISINKNGLWIKEITEKGYNIINAEKLEGDKLKDVSVYVFDENNKVIKRFESEIALINNNPWKMQNASLFDLKNKKKNYFDFYEFKTDKSLDKIICLYKNLNTLSFLAIVKNYKELNQIGYSKQLLNEQIHKFLSLPFFLFLMVILASIFTIGSAKTGQNFYYIVLSILISIVIFYFKDLSIALGQTEKISLVLSVWMPILAVGLFCSIGVIQINEK